MGLSMEATADQVSFRDQGAKALPAQIFNDRGMPAKSELHVKIWHGQEEKAQRESKRATDSAPRGASED